MSMTERIRVLLVKRGNISESELARRLGISPQNFHNKLKRDNFSLKELQDIAAAVGCEFNASFILPNTGEQI